MSIKHLPCGLFPHFDSGLERRPFLACAGETVLFGCRLDDSAADGVALVLDSGERIEGRLQSRNDRGQRYFSFSLPTARDMARISYRFLASDGEESRTYSFELLETVALRPTQIVCSGQSALLQYDVAGGSAAWRLLCSDQGIDLQFIYYLNVKINREADVTNASVLSERLSLRMVDDRVLVYKDNAVLAALAPCIHLLRDQSGGIYEMSFDLFCSGKAFYGFGEKFDRVEQSGLAPLNFVVEQYANQQDKTYAPIPFFYTDDGVGFLQTNSYRSRFTVSEHTTDGMRRVTVTARSPRAGRLFSGRIQVGDPAAQIAAYQRTTGAAALPPVWAFGPWMSSNGWNTQAEALEQVEQMRSLAIPATVMVLEAWSDEETFYIWNDAVYAPRADGGAFRYADFRFPPDGKWPDPMAFTKVLAQNGLKLVLWQIPVIKYEAQPHGEQLDLDTVHAISNGYCIKNEDGSPYRITEMWFGNSLMPDFTNEAARRWWFDKRRYLVEELGVAGFKTDGGEFLFDETASFSDGRSVLEGHNEYPNLYEGAYHDFLRETLGDGQGVTFSRAGYSGAQRYPLHWAGDQISTFSELRGQLTAGLSIGLSGVPFWGFDIGGFAGDFPSTELYLRATALAAFSPVMQFHSEPRYGQYYMTEREHWNNDRSPWNMAAANRDERIVPIYRLFANLRMNLLPYIYAEAKHCSRSGRPLMAHMIYDFLASDGDAVLHLEDQFLFGRELLIAPLVHEGEQERSVYLPKGGWRDFWTGDYVAGGETIRCCCALDRIPVFVRENAVLPINLNAAHIMGTQEACGGVSNRTDRYEQLALLLYGASPSGTYADGRGNDIRMEGGGLLGRWTDPIALLPMSGQQIAGGEALAAQIFNRCVDGRLFLSNATKPEEAV